jgi:elongator complex protein 1
MSLHQVSLSGNALDVAISASNSRIAVLVEHEILVFALDVHKKPIPEPTFLWRRATPLDHSPRQIAIVANEEIFLITDEWNSSVATLWKCEEQETISYGCVSGLGSGSSIAPSLSWTGLFLQTSNGSISSIDTIRPPPDTRELNLTPVAKFPSPASLVRIATGVVEVSRNTKPVSPVLTSGRIHVLVLLQVVSCMLTIAFL